VYSWAINGPPPFGGWAKELLEVEAKIEEQLG
jgi:hypothetical protein